jgi:hypothetical protein
MGIAPFSSSDGFGLRPLLLNRIQVRTIGRQELDGVPLLFDRGNDICSFVEGGTIQNDDGTLRYYRKESIPHPAKEDVRVDVAIPQVHGQKCERQNSADGIQAPFGMPVPLPVAARSNPGIAMRSRRIDRKPALVEVHDWTLLDVFVPSDSRLELQTMNCISFGMKQSFFYS